MAPPLANYPPEVSCKYLIEASTRPKSGRKACAKSIILGQYDDKDVAEGVIRKLYQRHPLLNITLHRRFMLTLSDGSIAFIQLLHQSVPEPRDLDAMMAAADELVSSWNKG